MLYSCQQPTYATGSRTSVPAASVLTQNTARSSREAGRGNEDLPSEEGVSVRTKGNACPCGPEMKLTLPKPRGELKQRVPKTSDPLPTVWLHGVFIGLPFDVPTAAELLWRICHKAGGSKQTTAIIVKLGGDNAVDTSARRKASWFCSSKRSSEKLV